jgi:MFS family permease
MSDQDGAAPGSADAETAAVDAPVDTSLAHSTSHSHHTLFDALFSLHAPTKKRFILASAAFICMLTPFCDTIYLPALKSVAETLPGASDVDRLQATVSVYMAAVGIFSLVWGPVSDRWGRLPPIYVALVLFIAVTAGCAEAPDVDSLIVLRAVQGGVVGATATVTQGVVADVFAPHERGTAMGWFLVPLLVGPIAAPIVGGALAAYAGWRSTMYLLLGLAVALLGLAAFLPETHHYHVLHDRICKGKSKGADSAAAAAAAPSSTTTTSVAVLSSSPPSPSPEELHASLPVPVLVSPFHPLAFLVEKDLAPFVAVGGTCFASMFVALTSFPLALAQPPYALNEATIGICYLPIGVSLMLGSQIGGRLSDKFVARAGPGAPACVRLVPSLAGALFLPLGCIVHGLCLAYQAPLGAVLLGHALVGLGQALFGPGVMAYTTTIKQKDAAGVSAASMALNFALSGVLISAAVPLQEALGVHGLYGLLAAANVAMLGWAAGYIAVMWRKGVAALPPHPTGKGEVVEGAAAAAA